MEGHDHGEESGTNEQTPLISNTDQSQEGTSQGSSETSPDPSKGFNFRRSMIIPMCACYFFAGGIYIYQVPQYTNDVMKRIDEKVLPHEIRPQYMYILQFQSKDKSEVNGCSAVNKSDPAYKTFTKVQQDTAVWLIYLNVASLLPAMFANLVWASYSDRIGRKFSLMICLFGAFVRMAVFSVVVYFDLSLVFIVISNIFDGLTGSFTSFFACLFSYVSDITYTGKQRTIAIVIVELVIGLAFTMASLISGYLIRELGYFYPAVGNSCLALIAIVILFFFVEETMQTRSAQGQCFSLLKSIAESVRFYFCDGTKIKRAKYILLLLAFFFMGIPSLSRMSLEVLYQLGRPFCWSTTKVGWFGAVKMAFSSLFGIGGAYTLKRCMDDDTIAFLSLVLSALAFVVEGLAKTDFMLYSVTVISAPSGLPFPMIRSLMSCLTPADKQGAMFASIGFVETLCSLVGSVSSNAIYKATVTVMTGFVFLLMAGFTVIGAIFVLLFMIVKRKFKDPISTMTIIVDPEASTIEG